MNHIRNHSAPKKSVSDIQSRRNLQTQPLLAPNAQIARFDAWNDVKGGFEMAYLPSQDDYLKWTLTNAYKPTPTDPPFINGIQGPLYGRNTIPVQEPKSSFCYPYILKESD